MTTQPERVRQALTNLAEQGVPLTLPRTTPTPDAPVEEAEGPRCPECATLLDHYWCDEHGWWDAVPPRMFRDDDGVMHRSLPVTEPEGEGEPLSVEAAWDDYDAQVLSEHINGTTCDGECARLREAVAVAIRADVEARLTPDEFETLEASLQIHTDAFAPCEPDCDCIIHPLTAIVARLAALDAEGNQVEEGQQLR